jgi:tRNA G46 methylase TrmB
MRAFDSVHLPFPKLAFDAHGLPPHRHLDIEIGSGQGLHAIRYCKENPARHLIAVEKTHERFAKLQGRKSRHPELANLTCLHADATSVITHHIPHSSLDRVFVLYPNPYQKNSQANLRWHNRPFISTLLLKMKKGSQLILATNIESYANEAAVQFVREWGLRMAEFSTLPASALPRTHFEKKYLLRGEKCWNLIFCNDA